MKERPILFSAPMVRAILEGRKTQTRRIMKVQPPDETYKFSTLCDTTAREERKHIGAHHFAKYDGFKQLDSTAFFRSPYGYKGDRLWVRENFAYVSCDENEKGALPWGTHEIYPLEDYGASHYSIRYAATEKEMDWESGWRPSIHMPRWASRITLEITNIRVERLQDISEEDAKAEGVTQFSSIGAEQRIACDTKNRSQADSPYTLAFASLWSEINGAESWNANPWVWVVEFKVVTP